MYPKNDYIFQSQIESLVLIKKISVLGHVYDENRTKWQSCVLLPNLLECDKSPGMGALIWPQISQNRCFDGQLALCEGVVYHKDSEFVFRKNLACRNMVRWNEG